MTDLLAAAEEARLLVIEDAAQAHGAEWLGRRSGSFGDAACFSFYPGKNLGAFGDAGAVVMSQPELADRVRALANHGRSHGAAHYEHDYLGTNSRLDALQAIALSGKLARLDAWTERRIQLAARYRDLLKGVTGVKLTAVSPSARHVYHLFTVRICARRGTGRADPAWHPDWSALSAAMSPATPAARVRERQTACGRAGSARVAVAAAVPAHDRCSARLRVWGTQRRAGERDRRLGVRPCRVNRGKAAWCRPKPTMECSPAIRQFVATRGHWSSAPEPGSGTGTVLYDGTKIGRRLHTWTWRRHPRGL